MNHRLFALTLAAAASFGLATSVAHAASDQALKNAPIAKHLTSPAFTVADYGQNILGHAVVGTSLDHYQGIVLGFTVHDKANPVTVARGFHVGNPKAGAVTAGEAVKVSINGDYNALPIGVNVKDDIYGSTKISALDGGSLLGTKFKDVAGDKTANAIDPAVSQKKMAKINVTNQDPAGAKLSTETLPSTS
jgi:hypothetical protein